MSLALLSLGLLCLAASIQGFTNHEDGLRLLEELESEVENHMNGVQLLISDGTRKIEEEYGLSLENARARSLQYTNEVLEEAEKRGCPEVLKEQLNAVGYSIEDRWSECMNLTEKAVEFEKVAYLLYQDFLVWKPKVCSATNGLLVCMDKNIFLRFGCLYESIGTYMTEFSDMKKQVVALIEDINHLVNTTVQDFIGCFGAHDDNVQRQQAKMLETHCPVNRFGLYSRN